MTLPKKSRFATSWPNLGVRLLNLGLADHPGSFASPGEGACHPVNGLARAQRDHRMVQTMLSRQLRQRQVAPDGFQLNRGVEIRAVALSRRLQSRTILPGRGTLSIMSI